MLGCKVVGVSNFAVLADTVATSASVEEKVARLVAETRAMAAAG